VSNSHAFLAPSSAGLTVNCHAAPLLQQPYPDDDTFAAMEGTAAHWVKAEATHGTMPAVGTLAPNGVAVTQEMIEGAELAIDSFKEHLGGAWRQIITERTLRGADLHPTHNGGTPDDYFVYQGDTEVIVWQWDYKFGHGFVEEYEAWQNINYASLILENHSIRNLPNVTVHMTIVQPRCYVAEPVRTWTVKATELVPYWDRLRKAFHAATGPMPAATPGPWCNNHYCRARHACPALQRSAYFAAEEAYRDTGRELGPNELGIELRIVDEAIAVLLARRDGLGEQALSLMQSGKNIPHYMIGRTQPRAKWTKGPQEIITLGKLMGLPLAKPPEPITPAQALKAGLPEDVLKAFSETPPGTPKLVRDTKLQARRVFSL
jgi:hypothetical protein